MPPSRLARLLASIISLGALDCAAADERDVLLALDDAPAAGSSEVAESGLDRPGCTARTTIGGTPAWLHFTRPDAPCTPNGPGLDRHAIDELIRLIGSVPAGGRIDGHVFHMNQADVAGALVDAEARGVEVWISGDGSLAREPDTPREILEQLTHLVYCGVPGNDACIGTAAAAISHVKLFVFSHASAPDGAEADDVVWFGSPNQTDDSGMRLYNDTVTTYGDPALHVAMTGYLRDLYHQARRDDYYDPPTGRGRLLTGTARVYVSPEVDSDLVVNRLDDLEPGPGCRIDVMHASIRDSRLDVVRLLVDAKRAGCRVRVVADTVEPAALLLLRTAGIPVRHQLIHDKVFLVRGRYRDGVRRQVYTGSHNLSGSANGRFDEIFVALAPERGTDHPTHDAFAVHFMDAYARATPL